MHALPSRALVRASLLLCTLAACSDPATSPASGTPRLATGSGGISVVNVSRDTTAQNETPLAVNPVNPQNLITGSNDWNYNDGCGVNASFDGGRSWTRTLPSGFLPGVTKYTNDPDVDGTGAFDYGGDPAVAFGPNGVAYFACFGYQAAPPYNVPLLLSRSTDGGKTWLAGGPGAALTQVSIFQGTGISRGSTGQFPDHEAIHVANDGTIYATWAQFNGYGSRSPVFVSVSNDGGLTFSNSVKVTSGSVRSDQDQRIVTDPQTGIAYITFDNSVQGGKGTAMFVTASANHGITWSTPYRFATFQNPVCLFPPYCFNISGGQFRAGGSYPTPAFDPTRRRLWVAYADLVDGRGQVFLTWASVDDLTKWSKPAVVAPVPAGDRFMAEMSIEPGSGRIDLAFWDRSYSSNALLDMTYATSADGGATWRTKRVTRSGWDPSQYGVPDGSQASGIRPFIGDYNGIVSLPGSAGITYTGPGATWGTLPTNLEVYFASVTP